MMGSHYLTAEKKAAVIRAAHADGRRLHIPPLRACVCKCVMVCIMCAHLTQDLLNISKADIKLRYLLSADPNVSKESSIAECRVLNFGL